jgi:hypothetical protein
MFNSFFPLTRTLHAILMFELKEHSLWVGVKNTFTELGREYPAKFSKNNTGLLRGALHVVQTGSGAHPASFPIGTGALSPGIKRPGRGSDPSSRTSAEAKKTWIYTCNPSYAFVA